MSPLAQHIYDILRGLVPVASPPLLTYGDLVGRLQMAHPAAYGTLTPRQRRLHDALGEVVRHCQNTLRLPALSALVVNAGPWIPGTGYYGVAHAALWLNGNGDWVACVAAWADEAQGAAATTYP